MLVVARRHLAETTCRCWHSRRNSSSLPPLPPVSEWNDAFKHRFKEIFPQPFLNSSTIADDLVKKFLRVSEGDGGPQKAKVVIEAYPGAGALTRSLLSLPPTIVKKVIALEERPVLAQHLNTLEQQDSRLTVVPESGFLWSTYTEVEARGLLNDAKHMPWDSAESPDIHFISHLPNTVYGDQLLAQIFRCMPDRNWLFKYGRIPLSFLMTESIWGRTSADVKKKARCKLSVIAEAVADCSEVLSSSQMPFKEHFYPSNADKSEEDSATSRRRKPTGGRQMGVPYVAVNIEPKVQPLVKPGLLDKWDFLTRKLFVLKASPIAKAIPSIAPGANSLLTMLANDVIPGGKSIDFKKQIRHLTVEDWAILVQAFDEWPFAPEDLLVSDTFYKDLDRERH